MATETKRSRARRWRDINPKRLPQLIEHIEEYISDYNAGHIVPSSFAVAEESEKAFAAFVLHTVRVEIRLNMRWGWVIWSKRQANGQRGQLRPLARDYIANARYRYQTWAIPANGGAV